MVVCNAKSDITCKFCQYGQSFKCLGAQVMGNLRNWRGIDIEYEPADTQGRAAV